MRDATLAGTLLVVLYSTSATAAAAAAVPTTPALPARHATATPTPFPAWAASSLYSRRSRRLVQSYLRLKLLETRLAGLDRARLVVERRLGVGALLDETPPPVAR